MRPLFRYLETGGVNSNADSVRAAFSEFGEVTDIHIMSDRETGQSRGFGFVTMGTAAAAAAAIAKMNGAVVDGRPLKVNEAEERQNGGGNRGGGNRGGHRGW